MRIARIRHYPSGMRIVEADLEYRIGQWAERRGVTVSMTRDGNDIVLDFAQPESATLFALEFPLAD